MCWYEILERGKKFFKDLLSVEFYGGIHKTHAEGGEETDIRMDILYKHKRHTTLT